MAGLLDRPTTDAPEQQAVAPDAPTAPEAPQPEAPARTCATCSAVLADGQDWCLECGSAQPGRLGGRPGWRAALTVLAVTGVLVGGAGAAAYAALSTEAQEKTGGPAPVAAAPQTQAPPAITPPAVSTPAPPAGETPSVPAPKSEAPSVPPPADAKPKASAPVAPPAPVTPPAPAAPSGGSGSAGGDTATETAPTGPVALDLPAEAAAIYDPFKRTLAKAGDPADAIDGKSDTAFELPVAPDGTVRAGLTLSLEKAQALSDLAMTFDTPGFTVEIYATKEPTIPPDVLDARWEHVSDRRDVGIEEKVSLDGKYRHVLLWVTAQPADTKVAIPEVQLFD